MVSAEVRNEKQVSAFERERAKDLEALRSLQESKNQNRKAVKEELVTLREFLVLVGGYHSDALREQIEEGAELPFTPVRVKGKWGIDRKSLMDWAVSEIESATLETDDDGIVTFEAHPDRHIHKVLSQAERLGLLGEAVLVNRKDFLGRAHVVNERTEEQWEALLSYADRAIREIRFQLDELTDYSEL